MNKNEIVNFFDDLSKDWDSNLIINEEKFNQILDSAYIEENCTVLDVACGTGVMIPYYLSRGVKHVTGIDISSKMIECAKNKFHDNEKVNFVCCDADSFKSERLYDRCMIFNALPHFIDPLGLLKNLYNSLTENGRLTVAHDMGRKALDRHHSNCAKNVSCGLMSEDDLENIFIQSGFRVISKHANDDIYIVSGIK